MTREPFAPEKQSFLDYVERNRESLADLNDSIFYFGELGMQEHRSAELMCSLLEEHGFSVERGICGFPTGFVAVYGSGSPVIAIHTEYDANPANSQAAGATEKAEIVAGAPGHCEGHNSNAAVMVIAAIGIRLAMEKFNLAGTLKIVGAPAEETLISRPYFVRDGVFDDVDVAFHDHILTEFRSDSGHIQYAAISADFVFHGESAHAVVYPHQARDALDAVVLMDMGVAQFREHFEPQMSAHRVITHGGHQPNVIPALASVWWYFRHPFADGAQRLFSQAIKIAQGAALMTNCELEVSVRSAVWPVRLNEVVAEVIQKNIEAIGMPAWTDEEQALARELQSKAGKPVTGLVEHVSESLRVTKPAASSNDCGDVSWKVPMGRVWFPSNVPSLGFHHWSAGSVLATSIAHKGAVAGAKALGASVLDYFLDEGRLMARTKSSFGKEIGDTKYRSLLPEGQKPPVELNRPEMEKFRSLMEPHYLNKRPAIVA